MITERASILSVELISLSDEEVVIHLYKLQALYRLFKTELYEVAHSTMTKSRSARSFGKKLEEPPSSVSLASESEIEGPTDAVEFETRLLKPLELKIEQTQAEIERRDARYREAAVEIVRREGPPFRRCGYVFSQFECL